MSDSGRAPMCYDASEAARPGSVVDETAGLGRSGFYYANED